MQTIKDYSLDIERSLYYFLNNEVYSGSRTASAGKTLKGHFTNPNLDIILGWPDNLEKLNLPTIALTSEEIAPEEFLTFGNELRDSPYSFSVYGFSGGTQSTNACKKQQREILNDVKGLLEQSEYIDYYEGGQFVTSGSNMSVSDVSGSFLPVTGPLDSERYRFVINFTVNILKEN